MSEQSPFVRRLQEHDPELAAVMQQLRELVYAPGALEVKTKLLIAMALDAQANHPNGVAAIANQARAAGASEAEIRETLRVTYEMAAMQVLVTQLGAFREA